MCDSSLSKASYETIYRLFGICPRGKAVANAGVYGTTYDGANTITVGNGRGRN